MSEETDDIAGAVAGKLWSVSLRVPFRLLFLCMAHRESLRCVSFIPVPVRAPLFWCLWDRMGALALSSNTKLIFPDH